MRFSVVPLASAHQLPGALYLLQAMLLSAGHCYISSIVRVFFSRREVDYEVTIYQHGVGDV